MGAETPKIGPLLRPAPLAAGVKLEELYAESETTTFPRTQEQAPRARLFDAAIVCKMPELPGDEGATSGLQTLRFLQRA
jgi:hypothetical protein